MTQHLVLAEPVPVPLSIELELLVVGGFRIRPLFRVPILDALVRLLLWSATTTTTTTTGFRRVTRSRSRRHGRQGGGASVSWILLS